MATRAAQLALFIVEFVTAARTPAPVFAPALARGADFLRRGFMPRAGILFVSGHRSTFSQEALPIKYDSANAFEEPGQRTSALCQPNRQKECFRWECEGYPETVGLRHDWLQDDE